TSDAVADVIPHDGIAMRFRMRLDREPDVADVVPVPALFNRPVETFLGDANQLQQFLAGRAHGNGGGGVSDKSFKCGADVYRKNIPLFQFIFRGKAMHHLLIDRSADRKGISVVTFESWISAGIANHAIGSVVDFQSRDAWLDHPAQLAQNAPHQLA